MCRTCQLYVRNFDPEGNCEQPPGFRQEPPVLFTAARRRKCRYLTLTAHFVSSIHTLYYDDFS